MKSILAFALIALGTASASAGQFGWSCCQSCGGTCVLTVEQVEEEDTCYDVECQQVCIPPVRFPWDACRSPRCGRVRLVAKLKEENRKTSSCKYEWVITCTRCGRIAAPEKAAESNKAKEKSADGAPPVPPMPPAAPPSNAAGQDRLRLRSAARAQAMNEFPGYSSRSSTK